MLTKLHLINNATNYVLPQLKFEFLEKLDFLKIHIKDRFSTLFSPIIDV